jgi:hypothetical protein
MYQGGGGGRVSLCVVNVTWIDLDPLTFIAVRLGWFAVYVSVLL